MLASLIELRQRLIQSLLIFLGFFGLFFLYAADLFNAIVSPLVTSLPLGSKIIATELTATVLTPLKLAAHAAFLCVSPVILFQLWRFAAPGLYKFEKHRFLSLIVLSFLLFCAGLLFCFYCVLPFMFQCFYKAIPAGVTLMPDMNNTIEFMTHMLFVFGFCFQLPLISVLLVQLQWLTLKQLQQFRPYAIVLAFILGMLLTPPDVLSQILLALPLCFLYELGIMLTKFRSLLT